MINFSLDFQPPIKAVKRVFWFFIQIIFSETRKTLKVISEPNGLFWNDSYDSGGKPNIQIVGNWTVTNVDKFDRPVDIVKVVIDGTGSEFAIRKLHKDRIGFFRGKMSVSESIGVDLLGFIDSSFRPVNEYLVLELIFSDEYGTENSVVAQFRKR